MAVGATWQLALTHSISSISLHLLAPPELLPVTDLDLVTDTTLLVIRQRAESQNGGNKKTKHAKFFGKRTFLTPDKHTYVGV